MKVLGFFTVVLVFCVFCITLLMMTLEEKSKLPTAPVPSPMVETPQKNFNVIGWIPYWDQEEGFQSFVQHAESLDYLSVFWYGLSKEGNIITYQNAKVDKNIIDFAHQKNVKVLALLANLPDDDEDADWDSERVEKVITTPQARAKHIAAILKLVEENNFDGISLDYENLDDNQRNNFSNFVTELAQALHANGKELGVAIHPKTGEGKPSEDNGSRAQDLTKIAASADHLYFMTYLEHGEFSEPGPPGSSGWIEAILRYALDDLQIPPQKVFMGIGLMGQQWRLTGSRSDGDDAGLKYVETEEIIKRYSIKPQWDNKSQTPTFRYRDNNNRSYEVWYENAESVFQRLLLARELEVGGIALWRLGGEDEKIWQKIDNEKFTNQ